MLAPFAPLAPLASLAPPAVPAVHAWPGAPAFAPQLQRLPPLRAQAGLGEEKKHLIVKREALLSMVEHMPKSLEELRACYGWGPAKVSSYGAIFLSKLSDKRGPVDLRRHLAAQPGRGRGRGRGRDGSPA